ncbi:uncharacterized protein LOC141853015 [Brevipalpus obovatus]|uniref:uncharacterized protein LOC141853015 n=1 Tax=Brevipalpus obovatus TaxID=246614 RepID=UPI003D9EA74D
MRIGENRSRSPVRGTISPLILSTANRIYGNGNESPQRQTSSSTDSSTHNRTSLSSTGARKRSPSPSSRRRSPSPSSHNIPINYAGSRQRSPSPKRVSSSVNNTPPDIGQRSNSPGKGVVENRKSVKNESIQIVSESNGPKIRGSSFDNSKSNHTIGGSLSPSSKDYHSQLNSISLGSDRRNTSQQPDWVLRSKYSNLTNSDKSSCSSVVSEKSRRTTSSSSPSDSGVSTFSNSLVNQKKSSTNRTSNNIDQYDRKDKSIDNSFTHHHDVKKEPSSASFSSKEDKTIHNVGDSMSTPTDTSRIKSRTGKILDSSKSSSPSRDSLGERKSSKISDKTVNKEDGKTSTQRNSGSSSSSKNRISSGGGKGEKSIEQILTEALQLSEDEKASLQRSRTDSLAQKWHNRKREEESQAQHRVNSASPDRRRSPSPSSSVSRDILKTSSTPSPSSKSDSSARTSLSSSFSPSSSSPTSSSTTTSSSPASSSPFSSTITISPTSASSSASPSSSSSSSHRENSHIIKDSYSSPINYAKTRFASVIQDASRGQLDRLPTQSMVSEVKMAWERKAAVSSTPAPTTAKNTSRINTHIRPYLSKGSVAERVMLFEKRPEVKREKEKPIDSSISLIRTKSPVLSSNWRAKNKENDASTLERRSSSKRSSKVPDAWATSHRDIPQFYFPSGRPYSQSEIEARTRKIMAEFSLLPDQKATKETFGRICKASGLPLYWKQPLYEAVVGASRKNVPISCDQYMKYWRDLVANCHENSSKFVRILSKGKRKYLISEDFVSMMQDVIETHPGLGFLKEAVEFHSRYVHTVIARIFYWVNKSWTGRITIPELRKSNYLAVVELLEEEEDINQITDYFSYEHFYVIYCKFWELDRDHDLIIDKEDLMRHNEAAISSRMIDRIFSGAVTRGPVRKHGKMTYSEFVWFLLSEEDKRHPRSVEYWFRCMDIDGDGFLSMYELEYFYEEQVKRMEALGIEALPFNDCLCQMIDMVRPKSRDRIALADLKRCKMTPVFFDTFFNLDKYLDHEQRDPFASKDGDENMISDWDKFAAEEYDLLVAEENAHHSSKD